jgi:hypothetical protein
MKKIPILLLTLALSAGFIKPVLAEVSPFGDAGNINTPNLQQIQFASADNTVPDVVQAPVPTLYAENVTTTDADLGLVEMNTINFQTPGAEIVSGKKYRVFNNQFVFQIDKDTFSSDATLNIRELALGPQSVMAAPAGFQFASRIYEYNLTTAPDVAFAQPFWFSVKYLEDDYFRKTMYYFDEQNKKWTGIESLISNGASKVISKTILTHAKLAILDDLNIMSEGTASWYKYKGCNCAASPDYPKGTKLKVTNTDNGKSIVVKVNDWGPDRSVFPNRVIDLDAVAFKQIAPRFAGLCKVKVELYQPVKAAAK